MRWRLPAFMRRCKHEFENTGDFHSDPHTGATIVIKRCAKCGLVVISEA